MIGYYQATPESASVEIRPVIVLPKYQRTFVTTHAIGLLLQYALEPPAGCRGQNSNPNGGGGLGLRRVEGYANVKNSPSIRAMERMGMNVEGIIRCVCCLIDIVTILHFEPGACAYNEY